MEKSLLFKKVERLFIVSDNFANGSHKSKVCKEQFDAPFESNRNQCEKCVAKSHQNKKKQTTPPEISKEKAVGDFKPLETMRGLVDTEKIADAIFEKVMSVVVRDVPPRVKTKIIPNEYKQYTK